MLSFREMWRFILQLLSAVAQDSIVKQYFSVHEPALKLFVVDIIYILKKRNVRFWFSFRMLTTLVSLIAIIY